MVISPMGPWWPIFVAIIAAAACLVSVRKPTHSILDVTWISAGLGALVCVGLETVLLGGGPLFALAVGPIYLMYLPMSVAFAAACRLLLRRKLYFFWGATAGE